MKNKNFENTWKEILENHEMDVPQHVWENISKQLASNTAQSSSQTGNGSTYGTKFSAIAKWAAGTFVAGTVAVSAYLMNKTGSQGNDKVVMHKSDTGQIVVVEEFPGNQPNTPVEKENTVIVDHSKEKIITQNVSNLRNEKFQSGPTPSDKNPTQKNPSEVLNKEKYNDAESVGQSVPEIAQNTSSQNIQKKVDNIQKPVLQQKSKVSNSPAELPAIIVTHPENTDDKTLAFSIDKEIDNIVWKIDNQVVSDQPFYVHSFDDYGTYTVELVLKEDGRSVKKEVEVTPVSGIVFVPNVFTPNNDGYNDVFVVKLQHMQSAQIRIFNIQGDLVYESSSVDPEKIEWNGRDNSGQIVPPGSYMYQLTCKGQDGKDWNKNGVVVLKR